MFETPWPGAFQDCVVDLFDDPAEQYTENQEELHPAHDVAECDTMTIKEQTNADGINDLKDKQVMSSIGK